MGTVSLGGNECTRAETYSTSYVSLGGNEYTRAETYSTSFFV
jgi:hypothetical protein